MKLHYVSRDDLDHRSFSITHHREPHFLKVWHYHPELELVFTVKSTGTRFVGDSIKKFEGGDLVLIGSNLPHMWLNDDAYFLPSSKLMAEDYVVHFSRNFLGEGFFEIGEMKSIAELLERSKYGIKFLNVERKITDALIGLIKWNDFERTIRLLRILNHLAVHKDFELLSSEGYVTSFRQHKGTQLDAIYEYIFENFSESISLADVAAIAHMNTSAFSRFFKRINRKTFSQFLMEVRIGYASKLLIEQNRNIASIGYESGFNNLSNFNRQFKKVKGMSPSEYQRQYH